MSSRVTWAVWLTVIVMLGGVGVAKATPIAGTFKLVPSRQVGWEVDRTTGGGICTVASKDECQLGKPSGRAGGFYYLGSVAVSRRTGNVYVADSENNRVQEFTAGGMFVTMFGWGVNKSKHRQTASTQTARNVCTATSGDICGPGIAGTAAEQFTYPGDVAVDPVTGDVYVLESSRGDYRIDKYTADGHFLLMIGGEVNGSTRSSVCTEREIKQAGMRCKAGAESKQDSVEPFAFRTAQYLGDLLAVGGPEDLLYVGDAHSVKEFEADGKYKREILLAEISSERNSHVSALVVDGSGDVYLVYHVQNERSGVSEEHSDVVREINSNDEQVREFPIGPRQSGMTVNVEGLAIAPIGRLAVIGVEVSADARTLSRFGWLYDGKTGSRLEEFPVSVDNDGMAFNSNNELYVAATDAQEVLIYVPVLGAWFLGNPAVCSSLTQPEMPNTPDYVS